MLKIEDLSVSYKYKGTCNSVLEEVTVSANKGEMVALLGSNGSGKSTLLRSISKLQEYQGCINISGVEVSDFSHREFSKILSFVGTGMFFNAAISVRELISLGRFPYTNWIGKLNENDQRIVQEAIECTQVQDLLDKGILETSDGEKQRVLIARALAQDTDIILLDEPTAFLDIANKFKITNILHSLAVEKGKTILFSSHDLNSVLQDADKVWLIDDKRVIEGAPEDIVLRDHLTKAFDMKDVIFSKSEGTFRVKKNLEKLVSLKCDIIEERWFTQALARIGYAISENAKISVVIDNPTRIIVSSAEDKMVFSSVYEMCNYLANLK